MTYSPLYSNKKQLKNIRASLRKNQTKSESLLWNKLRRKQTGYIFRRQFSIGNFVIDFYCNELKLIIEVDGNIHGENKEIFNDKNRENFLRSKGFIIVRYRNDQIFKSLQIVVNDIVRICKEIAEKSTVSVFTNNPSLPSPTRGGTA